MNLNRRATLFGGCLSVGASMVLMTEDKIDFIGYLKFVPIAALWSFFLFTVGAVISEQIAGKPKETTAGEIFRKAKIIGVWFCMVAIYYYIALRMR